MSASSPSVAAAPGALLRAALAVTVALALGVLTAYAQGWLPQRMGSLANSTGSWVLVACALSLVATSGAMAAAFCSASLLALLAGYVVGGELRGFASATATIVFWAADAVLAGPLLGVSAHWVKTRRDVPAAIGVGAVCGVLVGEGIYGLTRIAHTTYPPYWWGEIVVGVLLLVVVAGRRLIGVKAVAIAVVATALAAAAFLVVFSQDLLALLP